MALERRSFLAAAAMLGVAGPAGAAPQAVPMYGMIGKMIAQPGKREALAAILIEGIAGMPGCLSYVVANDPADADVLWITEAWESKDAHARALTLPSVRAAIGKGRPLIAGMQTIAETAPIGGTGLAPAR